MNVSELFIRRPVATALLMIAISIALGFARVPEGLAQLRGLWGAPIPNDRHAVDACRAALGCQRRLAELGMEWKEAGKPRRLAVRGGFVEVAGDVVRVLADQAVDGTQVDAAAVRQERGEARKKAELRSHGRSLPHRAALRCAGTISSTRRRSSRRTFRAKALTASGVTARYRARSLAR